MFAMRLALKLGRVNVDQMLAEISPQQFREWKAYEQVEPWGDEWRQSSTIATVVANEIRRVVAMFGNGNLEERDLYSLSNFVPYYRDQRLIAEQEEMELACHNLELNL